MTTVSNNDFPMERKTQIKRPDSRTFLGLLFFITVLSTSCEEKMYDCTRHDSEGNLKSTVPCDKNGVYQGEYLEYHKTGKLWERRFYIDGLQEDTTRYFFYKTGNVLKEVPMVAGKKHGVVRTFRKDGSVEKSESYADGFLSGPSTFFYENGFPKETFTYDQDQKSGPYFFHAEDSTVIVSGEYFRGSKYGKWTHFDYEGTQLAVLTYYNDKKEGGFSVFMEDGMPYLSGEFAQDFLHGDVNFYDVDGNIVRSSPYRNGRELAGGGRGFKQGRAILSLGGGKTVYIMPDTVWINQ